MRRRHRPEPKPPRLTDLQRRQLQGLVTDIEDDDCGTGELSAAIRAALAEIAEHRRFRKERSKRR